MNEGSLAAKPLPTVLSLTAVSVDVIGFIGLGGLFTAHASAPGGPSYAGRG